MKQHLERSVLSKLPDRYNSHLKQSVISDEDDMGIFFLSEPDIRLCLFVYNSICIRCISFYLFAVDFTILALVVWFI